MPPKQGERSRLHRAVGTTEAFEMQKRRRNWTRKYKSLIWTHLTEWKQVSTDCSKKDSALNKKVKLVEGAKKALKQLALITCSFFGVTVGKTIISYSSENSSTVMFFKTLLRQSFSDQIWLALIKWVVYFWKQRIALNTEMGTRQGKIVSLVLYYCFVAIVFVAVTVTPIYHLYFFALSRIDLSLILFCFRILARL